MERSPVVVILLCALCIPAALPAGPGSETPLGLELPSGSGSGLPSGSELPSRSGLEIPLGSELPLRSASELSSSSELHSEPELPSGLGSELPSGSELRSGSELLSGSELPSGSGPELPSGSELFLGSELPSGSGPELPSGSELLSESELPSGSERSSGSEPPQGSEPPSVSESVLLQLKAMVVLNSTPCSVTCGLGTKEELRCEVTPAGERRGCSLERSRCLSDWICGLRHLSVPQGEPARLLCLSPDTAGPEGRNFSYSWRFAPGLITTNDLLFRPFPNPSPSLSFSPALESHSGTYRCDVQVLSSFQVVKRVYFGLRVIPRDLVDLDFQKSLTWEQQLAANGEEPPGNASGAAAWERRGNFWEMQWFYEVVLGIGSGVIVGILFSLGLCCLGRVCRRRAAREMNGD